LEILGLLGVAGWIVKRPRVWGRQRPVTYLEKRCFAKNFEKSLRIRKDQDSLRRELGILR
jgi:hypothetical protein